MSFLNQTINQVELFKNAKEIYIDSHIDSCSINGWNDINTDYVHCYGRNSLIYPLINGVELLGYEFTGEENSYGCYVDENGNEYGQSEYEENKDKITEIKLTHDIFTDWGEVYNQVRVELSVKS